MSSIPTFVELFNNLKEGKLLGLKCNDCGTIACLPKNSCNNCGGRNLERTFLSGGSSRLTLPPTWPQWGMRRRRPTCDILKDDLYSTVGMRP